VETILGWLLLQAIACGLFCGYIAGEKRRSFGNWFILGFFFSIFALIAIASIPTIAIKLTASKAEIPNSRNAKNNDKDKATELNQLAPEEKNLHNDSYKLYLVEKYNISRNEVLNKFVLVNKLYQNLDEVLIAAHEKDKVESESDDKHKDSFQITSNNPNARRWLTMTVFSIARERDESERAVKSMLTRQGIRCKDFDGQQKNKHLNN